MQIDISHLADMPARDLSASVAEIGDMAMKWTWQAAQEQAEETPLLTNEEELEHFRKWLKPWGGWDEEEIAAMSDNELNALLLQWIAGDCRQLPATLPGVTYEHREGEGWFYTEEDSPDMETGPFEALIDAHQDASPGRGLLKAGHLSEIDWQAAEEAMEAGQAPSQLFRSDDGRIYFDLSH